jgi:hypothetical protein
MSKTEKRKEPEDAPLPTIVSKISKRKEQDFPRGGGSSLNPLEYRDIVKQVEKDVLFAVWVNICASNVDRKKRKRTRKRLMSMRARNNGRKRRRARSKSLRMLMTMDSR